MVAGAREDQCVRLAVQTLGDWRVIYGYPTVNMQLINGEVKLLNLLGIFASSEERIHPT